MGVCLLVVKKGGCVWGEELLSLQRVLQYGGRGPGPGACAQAERVLLCRPVDLTRIMPA